MQLKPGDVLICESVEAMEALARIKHPEINWNVPLVYCPKGVRTLSRQDLLNLLEQTDQSLATHSGIPEETAVPV